MWGCRSIAVAAWNSGVATATLRHSTTPTQFLLHWQHAAQPIDPPDLRRPLPQAAEAQVAAALEELLAKQDEPGKRRRGGIFRVRQIEHDGLHRRLPENAAAKSFGGRVRKVFYTSDDSSFACHGMSNTTTDSASPRDLWHLSALIEELQHHSL